MMTSFSSLVRLGASLVVLVPAFAACHVSGETLSVGSDAADGGGAEGGTSDAGAPCKTAADCGPDAVCGFASGAKCTDFGACFSTQGLATCAAYSPACACDGTMTNVACLPLPAGYTTTPIVHAGMCVTADADGGTSCTTDSDCGSSEACGFPRADACTATGTCFPKTVATCNAFLAGCACDGSVVNLVCNYLPSTHAPQPLRHEGQCVDGG